MLPQTLPVTLSCKIRVNPIKRPKLESTDLFCKGPRQESSTSGFVDNLSRNYRSLLKKRRNTAREQMGMAVFS